MNTIRHHFHALLGTFLLTTAAVTALGIYYEVPLPFQNRASNKGGMALMSATGAVSGDTTKAGACDHHSAQVAGSDHAAHGTCGKKEESGCCAKKEAPLARMVLPAGHPPVAGYTIGTDEPAN